MSTRASQNASSTPVRDISGYAIYADGELGAAHALAHRALDQNRFEQGYRELGDWLRGRSGSGSQWLHLHFHMAIFELALGKWHAAHARFVEHILPVVDAGAELALTDAPALAWRLQLSAPQGVRLPWTALGAVARANLERCDDPFVVLHDLLALAGEGDLGSIERWLSAQEGRPDAGHDSLVARFAKALHAAVNRAYDRAALILAEVVPQLERVGGSRAQNALFYELHHAVVQRADAVATPLPAAA